MKSKHVVIGFVVLLAIAAAWLARSTPTVAATPVAGTAWQYATLTQMQAIAVFNSPDGNHSARNLDALYREFGGTVPAEKFAVSDLLNSIGRQRWELVTVTESTGEATYYFKRPA